MRKINIKICNTYVSQKCHLNTINNINSLTGSEICFKVNNIYPKAISTDLILKVFSWRATLLS